MKRFWIVIVALVALGPACKKSATAPTGVTQPTQFVFAATLLPANEVPAATGPETAGSGTATITLNVTRDGSGTITSATTTFVVNLAGFPTGTNLTAAHIHPGAAGVAGNPLVNTGLTSGEVVINGSGSFTKSNVTTAADQAQSIITNPAGFYFNVHTTSNPGGVARGQLSLSSSK
jgi:hypothetical protein